MRMPLLVFLAVAALSSLVVRGQEPDPSRPDPVPAASSESSPEALALLDAAIRCQGPEAYALPGAIKDLTVRIQSTVWDYGRTPPQRIQIGVRRFLSVEPEKFRSEWKTIEGTQIQGFDGRRYWYWDKDGARWLMDDATKESREEVRKELDETKYLLRFFFLANMKGPQVFFETRPDEEIQVWGEKHTCQVLYRENRAPDSSEPPVSVWFDAETRSLLKAVAHASTYGQKSLIFLFRYSERVQPRVKGVLFPYQIEVREQPFGAEKDRISLIATLEEQGGIEFNTGLPKETFLRPK